MQNQEPVGVSLTNKPSRQCIFMLGNDKGNKKQKSKSEMTIKTGSKTEAHKTETVTKIGLELDNILEKRTLTKEWLFFRSSTKVPTRHHIEDMSGGTNPFQGQYVNNLTMVNKMAAH